MKEMDCLQATPTKRKYAREDSNLSLSLPIGALPLWRPQRFALQNEAVRPVTPTTWENSFPTPFLGSHPV